MSSRALTWESDDNPLWQLTGLLLRPLHLGLAFPSILYVAAMTVFLFRPPDIFSYYADRIGFGILIFFVALRTMALREKLPFVARLSLPMLCLLALAMVRALREPFDAQTWSIVASKFIVPFALFHVAVLVFGGPRSASTLKSLFYSRLATWCSWRSPSSPTHGRSSFHGSFWTKALGFTRTARAVLFCKQSRTGFR